MQALTQNSRDAIRAIICRGPASTWGTFAEGVGSIRQRDLVWHDLTAGLPKLIGRPVASPMLPWRFTLDSSERDQARCHSACISALLRTDSLHSKRFLPASGQGRRFSPII